MNELNVIISSSPARDQCITPRRLFGSGDTITHGASTINRVTPTGMIKSTQ